MARKFFFIHFVVVALFTLSTVNGQDPGNPDGLFPGYSKYLRGEKFTYHSLRPDVSEAMLVRSMEKEMNIEWETAPVPESFKGDRVRFIMMVNINISPDDPHSWKIAIDGKERFSIQTPASRSMENIVTDNKNGYSMEFEPVEVDRHGDMMGYLFITVPSSSVKPGKPVRISATGESAGSRAFFIVYRYSIKPGIYIIPEQAIRKDGKSTVQQVRVVYSYLGQPLKVSIDAGGIKTFSELHFGYNSMMAKIPVVKETTPFNVTISAGQQKLASSDFVVNPVIPRTIYLLHHSHVDIGYTHVQDEVEKLQWSHLEDAIRLADESRNNRPGERFKWNSEVMWALDSYLENHSGEKRGKLIEAIKKGDIEADASFANMLSELCNTEELVDVSSAARRLAKETGVPIESAMITDVPGWSQGLVSVLAQSGVKYLSLGTNYGHRIGTIMDEWGDRPFWWVSRSGEEKLLCWIHLNGYSMFHTGVSDSKMSVEKMSDRIFSYLNQLYERKYPYDIVPVRYNIGADNGPCDPDIASVVSEWNKIFVTPQLRISTVSETFSEFEKRYGNSIPVVNGAITGYWEDGAASSSLMTGLNRQAASNVNIATSLAVITGYKQDISKEVDAIRRNVMLYDEHTWGSWNSISDPEDPFTLSQWAVKSSFAKNAALESIKLRDRILGISPEWRSVSRDENKPLQQVEVINTHNWSVSQPVEIPLSWNPAGVTVKDRDGNTVPSQVLSSGKLLFVASDVPAMGSVIYTFSGDGAVKLPEPIEGKTISSDEFELSVDENTGAISSLYYKKEGINLVNGDSLAGLNNAWYVEGRSPVNRSTTFNSRVKIVDNGPLVYTLETESRMEGCNSVKSRYSIIKGLDRIYVTTVMDKKKVYDPEGVHIAFPFSIPSPQINIDMPLGIYRPGKDQARGACMNYFTAEHWIDISGKDYGVTLTSLDAPLFEIGNISTDATAYGWLTDVKQSATIYSYVMNNYWETNYLAAQEGNIPFRYVLTPHGAFNPSFAEKSATAEAERLVVVPGGKRNTSRESLFDIPDGNIVVEAIIRVEDGYLVRLFNAGGTPADISFKWKKAPSQVWLTDLDGNRLHDLNGDEKVPAWALRTIRVVE